MEKFLASGYKFFIEDAATPNTYNGISGVTNFSIEPSFEQVDTTDFTSGNYDKHMPVSGKFSISLEGQKIMKMTGTTDKGTTDKGQAGLELLSTKFGAAGLANFIVENPAGVKTKYLVSCEWGSYGGAKKDLMPFSVTLPVSGAPVAIGGTDTNTYVQAISVG